MTQRHWPNETKERAEKAMTDLEVVWARFRKSTQAGRRDLLPQITRLRSEAASASQQDDCVLDRLASLQSACKRLSSFQQPADFDEETQIVFGLGDLSMIRSQLYMVGLVENDLPPEL